MNIHKLSLQLAAENYPIIIGTGLIGEAGGEVHLPHFRAKTGVLITNETVAGLYLEAAQEFFRRAEYDLQPIVIPDGEQYKNREVLFSLYEQMFEAGLQRDSFVCALGGGVVGDLAGFAASTYMRGLDLVHLPTTLLAQVDSAIGGKNGINLPVGKNLIGTFYQPRAVISDVNLLATLPDDEFFSGLGEVVKYALIVGNDFVSFLEMNFREIMERVPKILANMVHYCCRIKADFVARDEKEQLGVRAILNLGHTMAHALETVFAYQEMKHGLAVAKGLAFAALVSLEAGTLSENEFRQVMELFRLFELDVSPPPAVDDEQLLTVMMRDKKMTAESLNMILLRSIGQPFLYSKVSRELLQAAFAKWRSGMAAG
ncbi:MAG: 3-dehydroquinate synthase [Deltaproteobacteria bacterium]|nr:3-dehydroquinate synthase [Deltaproteobacteria bacterium]